MNSKINPKLEVGDRIILIVMSDPYSPITVGTKGTVTGIGSDPWSIEPLYYVEWDNGSTLNLIGDEDVWVKDDMLWLGHDEPQYVVWIKFGWFLLFQRYTWYIAVSLHEWHFFRQSQFFF